MSVSAARTVDHRYLIPADFERASLFEVVNPTDNVQRSSK